MKKGTPPKFNIAPEKWWLEDKPFLLGFGNFSGAMLNFERVTLWELFDDLRENIHSSSTQGSMEFVSVIGSTPKPHQLRIWRLMPRENNWI